MRPVRVFDVKASEGDNAIVARVVDPDQAALRIHFVGNVPHRVLILAEHFGDAGDGVDMMNLVNRSQDQAAMADAWG